MNPSSWIAASEGGVTVILGDDGIGGRLGADEDMDAADEACLERREPEAKGVMEGVANAEGTARAITRWVASARTLRARVRDRGLSIVVWCGER
jgi:hypothetical protein